MPSRWVRTIRTGTASLTLWMAFVASLGVSAFIFPAPASAQYRPEDRGAAEDALDRARYRKLDKVGIDEKVGDIVPGDIELRAEGGNKVTLAELMEGGKPAILALVYYECPMLCNRIITGLSQTVKQMSWQPGEEYEIVMVSFDPNETSMLARMKKQNVLKSIDRTEVYEGWHFLTGEQAQIDRLTEAAGFNYKWEPQAKVWAHTAALIVLSPEGKITRYLYGLEYDPKTVRLSLAEQADESTLSTTDRVLLLCYRYDPDSGGYQFAMTVMRTIGGGIALALGLGIGLALWREHRKKQRRRGAAAVGQG